MNITSTAVAMAVGDPAAASRFFTEHLGFRELLFTEDLIHLGRDDAAPDLILIGTRRLTGPAFVLSFTVTGIAAEARRLADEGVTVADPLTLQPWGEWTLGLTGPDGLRVQFVEWMSPGGAVSVPGWETPNGNHDV